MSLRSFSPRRLTDLRIRARLSRQELATATRYSWFTVYGWERGKFAPSVESLARIADALGCPIDALFTDEESK